MISVVIPYHDMENGAYFLKRAIDSVMKQTYKDYEIVLVKNGLMAENTNSGIKRAKGEIVKILFMDDYLAHEYALRDIVDAFKGGWIVTGCVHDSGGSLFNEHMPKWTPTIKNGVNTIGSPSVLAFENKEPLLFDEKLSWTLDCDLYERLYTKYGEPTIINNVNVVIGLHSGQTTHALSDEQKQEEFLYINKKHG